jgi:hypothetical protein
MFVGTARAPLLNGHMIPTTDAVCSVPDAGTYVGFQHHTQYGPFCAGGNVSCQTVCHVSFGPSGNSEGRPQIGCASTNMEVVGRREIRERVSIGGGQLRKEKSVGAVNLSTLKGEPKIRPANCPNGQVQGTLSRSPQRSTARDDAWPPKVPPKSERTCPFGSGVGKRSGGAAGHRQGL